jgi:hypothetical protein
MLVAPTQAQQIATVDLTHTKGTAQSGRKLEKTELPKGCENLVPGMIGDGGVVPPNQEPREIGVEIVKLSNENPVLGSDLQAEIQLRNIGKYPIKIPWSTDPNMIGKGQEPNHLKWEEGSFRIELKHSYELLVNLSQTLFGTPFSAGSELTVQPGAWVTAVIKFKLAPQFALPEQSVRKGKRDLLVRWEQATESKDLKNCAVTTGWFDYRNYYKQQNPAIKINIK